MKELSKKQNTIENILCSGLWRDLNINFQRKSYRYCCKTSWEDIKTNNLVDLIENEEINLSRKESLEGIQTKACQICWNDEKKNNFNWRKIANRWEKDKLENYIEKYNLTLNTLVESPKVFVLTFDNLCDQSCLYCGSVDSSRWASELNIAETVKPVNEDIIQDLLLHIKKTTATGIHGAITIQILGGEPTYSANFYKFLEKLQESNVLEENNDCIIFSITTNLNTNKKMFEKFLKYIKLFKTKNVEWHIGVSNESCYELAENVRYGLKWENFDRNLRDLTEQKLADLIVLSPTLNVFVVKTFHEYIDYIYNTIKLTNPMQRLSWVGNWVVDPKALDIGNLDQNLSSYMLESKKVFLQQSNNLNTWKPNIFVDYITSMAYRIEKMEANKKIVKQYIKYLSKIKQNLNTSLLKEQL